jgi:GWxTD domain-containing protein
MRDAEAAFLEASAADPTAELPRRHVYMVLAERARWDELRRLASTHAAARPGSAIARLALGLADHRLALDADAATAFDSGLALLEPDERSRLTRLSRLLAPASEAGHYDSVRFAASGGAQRAAAERAFWLANTPLALRSVNPHRLEFLARVVFAELRWTAEEFGVRGADTDRGDIYVRYGPPERVVGLGAEAQKIQIDVTPEFQSRGVLRKPSPDSTSAPALGVSGELWMYPAGYSFLFVGPPAGGVTRLTGDFAGVAESQRASFPVIWSMRRYADELDSVPMFAARFRAPGDSMDLVVSAALPMAPLLGEVGRGRASVDVGLTLTTPDAEVAVRDSVRLRVAASDSSGARQWTRRLGAGPYAYRVEGYGVASGRAARGSAALGARPTRGFGTSDLLLAASVTPPASDRDAAPRWSDYPAVLNAGVFRRGAPVALLWETYALAAGADSISRYRVSVAVSPASDGAGTTLAARVLAGAASALGRSSERAGRRSLVYDRELHAAPAAVDYLSLDLSGAASGEYVVRVTVEDSITHRSATTTAAFRIIE